MAILWCSRITFVSMLVWYIFLCIHLNRYLNCIALCLDICVESLEKPINTKIEIWIISWLYFTIEYVFVTSDGVASVAKYEYQTHISKLQNDIWLSSVQCNKFPNLNGAPSSNPYDLHCGTLWLRFSSRWILNYLLNIDLVIDSVGIWMFYWLKV